MAEPEAQMRRSQFNKRFVYNEQTGKMEQLALAPISNVHLVMPDLPDFVSPVDGSVVHGRAGLREHDRRNGTTNIADYSESWKKAAEKRAEFVNGQHRTDPKTVARAFDDLKEGRVRPRTIRERDFERF